MAFRYMIGSMFALVALIFLVVNSFILGSFGYRWGHDFYTKIGMAAVAASIPWALAPMPHLMFGPRSSYGERRRFHLGSALRSVASFIALGFIYLVFVSYNVLGGTGMVAWQRTEVAEDRRAVHEDTERRKKELARLEAELAAIPAHRPAAAVEHVKAAHEKHVYWQWTQGCQKLRNKKQRDYCAEYANLDAEIANSRRADEVREAIKTLTEQLAEPERKVIDEDPQVTFLSNLTGLDRHWSMLILLLATPVVLEIGALTMASYALGLFRIRMDEPELIPVNRRLAPPAPEPVPLEAETVEIRPARHDPLKKLYGALKAENPIQQRAVFDEFWARRTRRLESGQVRETVMYEHYRALCEQRGVLPFSLETFRRLSADKIRASAVINGELWYMHVVTAEE